MGWVLHLRASLAALLLAHNQLVQYGTWQVQATVGLSRCDRALPALC